MTIDKSYKSKTLENKTHRAQKKYKIQTAVHKYPKIDDLYFKNNDMIKNHKEYPREIEIINYKYQDPNIDLNGVYEYYNNGGSGIVYHNKEKGKILKILYFNNIQSFENEITFQTLSGKHAPKIYAIIKKTFAGLPSNGFIMDFMEEDNKRSLKTFLQDDDNWENLFNFLFDVIKIKQLNLFADWMGQGDESTHLYLKNNKIVMIDYGNVSKIKPTQDYENEKDSYNNAIESIISNNKISAHKIAEFRNKSISTFNEKLKDDTTTQTALTRHLRYSLNVITEKNLKGGSRKTKRKKHKRSNKISKKKSSRKKRHKTKKK